MFDVTVLLLVYNGDLVKIRKTLDSVLAQREVRMQLVVADDGSKDNHLEEWHAMLREAGFADYTLVMNEANGGTVRNICSGLEAAEGRYTKLISPGDLLADPLVMRDWVRLMDREKAEWSFSDAVYYQAESGQDRTVRAPAQPQDLSPYRRRDAWGMRWAYLAWHDLALGAAVLSTTAVIRRACARIRDAGVRYAEDNMWRLLMFEGITPVYFPRAAVRYECAVGISASDVWKKRLLDDWAAADRLMREMPSPDAAQQKLLRALWPEGRLAEAVRVRGFLLFALRKRFRPRLSAESAATDTSGGKKACR